jgi:putative acetyltransferase
MTIRPEQEGDAPAIRRVVTAAFGGSGEADLIESLRTSPAWIPGLSLVAVEAEDVVGHVLLTRARIAGSIDALGLAPVAVEPPRQRRGIGDALVRAGLEAARARGERAVVVIGHPSYYPRFGFRPAVPRGLTSVFASGEHADAFMVLELQPGALDGVSGPVEYAEAFGAFE